MQREYTLQIDPQSAGVDFILFSMPSIEVPMNGWMAVEHKNEDTVKQNLSDSRHTVKLYNSMI